MRSLFGRWPQEVERKEGRKTSKDYVSELVTVVGSWSSVPKGPSFNPRSSVVLNWVIFLSQWRFAVFRDGYGCHNWEVLLASRMLLNILQHTGQPLTTNHFSTQNISGANVEKPASELSLLWMISLEHLSINSHPLWVSIASGSVNGFRPAGCAWIRAEQPSVGLGKTLKRKSRETHIGGAQAMCKK